MDTATPHGSSLASRGLEISLSSPISLVHDWPHAVPLLERAPWTWNRYYTLPQLFNEIFAERLHLWLGCPMEDSDGVPVACCLTTFDHYPLVKVLRFIILVGDDERHDHLEWQYAFREYVENWAAAQGATYAGVKGRKGWERVLAPHGYEPDGVYLRKSLIKGHVN